MWLAVVCEATVSACLCVVGLTCARDSNLCFVSPVACAAMDESFDFVVSTQAFEVAPDILPCPSSMPCATESCGNLPQPPSFPPMDDPAVILDISSDADVAPTEDSVFNQMLSFIDFMKDM